MKTINGFTLIELMITVAIIGILVAISIPIYSTYTQNAYVKSCLSEAKAYANITYYMLNDVDSNTHPSEPKFSSCQTLTDASSWDETTTDIVIEAKSKNSPTVNIQCDLSRGANCVVIP